MGNYGGVIKMINRKNIQEIIDIAKNKLVEVYSPYTIYLFGSYAWGIPNNDSDLDILIIVNSISENKTHKRVLIGRKALIDLDIPKDIMVYTKEEFEKLAEEKSSLCYKIKSEGVKLYEAA